MSGNKNLDKIIVMLTNNDVTVENAYEVFDACKDLPIKNWGFKDIGLPRQKAKELAEYMKQCGKTTTLEVVTYTEEGGLDGAKMAVECGMDHLSGALPYPSLISYAKEHNLQFMPFVGNVGGSPVELHGTLESILAQEKELAEAGIQTVDLLIYRYMDGDQEQFAEAYFKHAALPAVIAGSVGNEERIRRVLSLGAQAFTMGSALFKKNFVRNGTFRDNLEAVIRILETID